MFHKWKIFIFNTCIILFNTILICSDQNNNKKNATQGYILEQEYGELRRVLNHSELNLCCICIITLSFVFLQDKNFLLFAMKILGNVFFPISMSYFHIRVIDFKCMCNLIPLPQSHPHSLFLCRTLISVYHCRWISVCRRGI